MKSICFLIATLICASAFGADGRKPNVLIFYLDDMAYGDPACYGGKLAPTPHIDSLASNGVRFTDGYVSACVCAPSRVGLMTGRYQARSGHDSNEGDLALGEVTLAQRMKEIGYTTGLVGKWHLGSGKETLPAARGFDFSIGSVGNLGNEGVKTGFFRGTELISSLEGAPISSPVYAREACGFIERSQAGPWFLCMAFNAVHNPNVASQAVLDRFPQLKHRERDYAASIAEADDAIGTVLGKLRSLGLEEDTLIFCISDNGDSSPYANQQGLRGHKWLLWEGGIRVPWLVQWKGRIAPGRVVSAPVIQLDVLPTSLAAANAELKPEWQVDGVNLLPLLEGKTEKPPRDALFWRFGPQFAVRQGDWKLVKAAKDMEPMLVNLANDRAEANDLSIAHADKRNELQTLWNQWNAPIPPPIGSGKSWDGEEARMAKKQRKK
jgi:arylsulfatase A-like enzyme